jgi:hypothetical protein
MFLGSTRVEAAGKKSMTEAEYWICMELSDYARGAEEIPSWKRTEIGGIYSGRVERNTSIKDRIQ